MIGHQAAEIFKKAGSFIITSHTHPDGDAIGSMIGLGLALGKMGREVLIISEQTLAYQYRFLPGSELMTVFSESLNGRNFECGIVLDCTGLERLSGEIGSMLAGCETLINIDHHISNTRFGTVNVVDPEASATGEMLFWILSAMGIEIPPEVATNLYTALATDTGSFQYQNATPRCHLAASALLEHGADHVMVHRCLNEQKTLSSLRLLEKGLATLTLDQDGMIAWMTISRQLLQATGSKAEDSEDLINYPKSIAGVEVGILFKEIDEGEVRVGFRSKSFADVNMLAERFGGGGHVRAAGCTVRGGLPEVEALVINHTREYLRKMQSEEDS